jgi:hypothetical protein
MAATAETTEIELLTQRMSDLEKKMAELQTKLENLAPKLEIISPELLIPLDDPMAEKERIIALLKAKGLIVEPGPYIQAGAAEWNALSEEEKQEHRRYMDSLKLDPPLSQIIIDNRR